MATMKRAMDLLLAGLGILVLSPALAILCLAIAIDSAGPVFYVQDRVGRAGRIFRIFKLRTMHSTDYDLSFPPGRGARVTRLGYWLRRYKLDELPQLLNVLFGDMSLVGPRPELPRFVRLYPPLIRDKVLSLRPGITDLASNAFVDEEEMLAAADDPEYEYTERILPVKLALCLEYVEQRSIWLDVRIICRTLMGVVAQGK